MAEHYSRDAERGVLGAMLQDTSVLPRVLDRLTVADFYFDAHKDILKAFISLQDSGTPADPVLLANALDRSGRLESVGGHLLISKIMDQTPSAALVEHYCRLIKDKSITRAIIEAAQRIMQKAESTMAGNGDELTAYAQQEIMSLTATTMVTGADMRTLVLGAFGRIEERYKSGGDLPGITSGYMHLDALLGGWKPGLFYPIAGRPGTGKTAIALNMARTAASTGKSVVFFSLEMPKAELTNRLISSESGVDGHQLSRGYLSEKDYSRASGIADTLARLPIIIDDASLSIDRIATRARRHKADRALDLVIVDYLQLVPPSRRWNTREQEVSEVSRTLKAIAKELEVPVIAGAQLNRNIENRTKKTPTLADLRESGAIEQDADAVIFLSPIDAQGTTKLTVEKNRQGPTGSVTLFFDKKTTTFKERMS